MQHWCAYAPRAFVPQGEQSLSRGRSCKLRDQNIEETDHSAAESD